MFCQNIEMYSYIEISFVTLYITLEIQDHVCWRPRGSTNGLG